MPRKGDARSHLQRHGVVDGFLISIHFLLYYSRHFRQMRRMKRHIDSAESALLAADAEPAEDDFDQEIERVRGNAALIELLRERSQEQTRVTAQEARKRLGLD